MFCCAVITGKLRLAKLDCWQSNQFHRLHAELRAQNHIKFINCIALAAIENESVFARSISKRFVDVANSLNNARFWSINRCTFEI